MISLYFTFERGIIMVWRLEMDVNDWVKSQFLKMGLEKHKDFNEESAMSDYLKDALKGSAKTNNKSNFGKPDFHIEKYDVPVIIENKLSLKKLIARNKDGIKFDDKSISAFAVNGALHYARCMIASGKYKEVISIGIAGDSESNVTINVFYVFGSADNAFKELTDIVTLDFLESAESFSEFYSQAILSEADKHKILINSQTLLKAYAKKLNKLMQNHNITAPQRVLYVSGMLLSMQDIIDVTGVPLDYGLTPEKLEGIQINTRRDGQLILNHIANFLEKRGIADEKRQLMLSSFNEISKDIQRDELVDTDKLVAKLINGKASINKQIFVFIYEYIFKSIDGLGGHIDIMGEMYSEFLKYALGDGKEIGIVLTPPYVTKMMAQLLGVTASQKVMDLATGSAGFLISAMELMIDDANIKYGKNTSKAKELINEIKHNNLLGVELNAEMYTLATTNMILRGDGSSRIEKGNAFNRPDQLYTEFRADRVLLNPPFSYEENGLPFIQYGLDKMAPGGLGAIIIQDSAGAGKGIKTAKEILLRHTLVASIKMPIDLFLPMAGVQTSIYIFEAHKPHDFDKTVKFIDFRVDGYKRTGRGFTYEVDNPAQRYQDIVKIFKAGNQSRVSSDLWDLRLQYIEDFISDGGNDWNFDQHVSFNTDVTMCDFVDSVSNYYICKVMEQVSLERGVQLQRDSREYLSIKALEEEFESKGGGWRKYRVEDLFSICTTPSLNKESLTPGNKYDYVTRTSQNQGVSETTGEIENEIINEKGVWSLGLLQMDFFYRPRRWYAGQFVRTIKPKIDIPESCSLYISTILNKLSPKLLAGLVRDVDETFLNSEIKLPIMNGVIAYEFMHKYTDILLKANHSNVCAYWDNMGLCV